MMPLLGLVLLLCVLLGIVYHKSNKSIDESEENYEYLEVVPAEEVDKNLSLETASMLRTNGSNYLVILPSGEKHVYRNCSKEFILSIINSIGSHVQLFELNEIELKSEVKYSF